MRASRLASGVLGGAASGAGVAHALVGGAAVAAAVGPSEGTG